MWKTATHKEPPAFFEEQRFVSVRLSIVLFIATLLASAYLVFTGRPRELLGVAVAAVLIALFYLARLSVRVSAWTLDIAFHPFVERRIPLAEIAACEARCYRPLREYGGWGIRWGWKGGRAYNVSGCRGVQLTLHTGESILLGSQRSEELASAIRQRMPAA